MAAEYVVREGNDQVMLCERGIKTFETSTRYTLDIGAVPVLKQETHLPVIVDPSHAAGRRDLVLPLARAAVAAGADGIIVEVHPEPEQALCDGPQQIPTGDFAEFARRDLRARRADGQDRGLTCRSVQLAVVGTGLIGASVGLAAKRAGVEDVRGFDPDDGGARGRGRARRGRRRAGSLEEAVGGRRAGGRRGAGRAARRVGRGRARGGRRGTVTDVGSTKARASCAPRGSDARFIGGHPVCGSEARGPEHARGRALRGRDVVPDAGRRRPTRSATARCTASSRRSARCPSRSTRDAHDRLVALTSHLPHALANLLVNQAGATRVEGHEPLAAAGGSLRDMTRVAGANPRIWVDIFLENADALRDVARRAPAPGGAARARARGGRRRLPRALDRARPSGTAAACSRRRTRTPARCSGCASTCPTGPGCWPGSRRRSARERINIEDFELHHMSPERGGVPDRPRRGGARPRARAAALLEAQGYGVVVSPVLGDE